MGKKRITQLLEELQANQSLELENAAAVFTVAQVAVNQLQAESANQPVSTIPAALPPAPNRISRADLMQQYGSHVNCRRAAKAQGIKFRKTPTWEQLAIAFSYVNAFQQLIQSYMASYPNDQLHGLTIELTLD